VRDLQVKTPAPGFLTGSYPKVVRRHGQPAHTIPPAGPQRGTNPSRKRGSSPSPPRPAPARIFTQRDHPPDVMSFLYSFKGAPPAPGLTAPGVNSEDGREQPRGKGGQGDPPLAAGVHPGLSPLRAAAFRRALWAEAHQARRLPRTVPPVTGRLRFPPYPAAAPPAPRPGRRPRARVPIAVKMSQRRGRNAAHCPGWPLQRQGYPKIVSKTASQKRSSGPTLERRSLYQPSGPDGEGQARGHALWRAANPRRVERSLIP
jgi:hypothetical protein